MIVSHSVNKPSAIQALVDFLADYIRPNGGWMGHLNYRWSELTVGSEKPRKFNLHVYPATIVATQPASHVATISPHFTVDVSSVLSAFSSHEKVFFNTSGIHNGSAPTAILGISGMFAGIHVELVVSGTAPSDEKPGYALDGAGNLREIN